MTGTTGKRDSASASQAAPLPRYKQVAAMVRHQVADGVLAPGALAPSGAALSRITGYSVLTCRRALRTLIKDGTLLQGTGPRARPRVPSPGGNHQVLADAKRALSAALAEHRRAAGLTQPQLAELIGVSVTRIGHAETGRLWQSRPFWENADKVLDAGGGLLRLHDVYRAAEVPPSPSAAEDIPPETGRAESTAVVTVNVPQPVTCITVTWVGGTVTTVYPPTPEEGQPEQ
jgi:DNA-binding transcriptional regulator YhcF (GntR family)